MMYWTSSTQADLASLVDNSMIFTSNFVIKLLVNPFDAYLHPRFLKYLFISLHWVLVSACRIFIVSCVTAQGSIAVVHGSRACGILVPKSGIKPASTALQVGS